MIKKHNYLFYGRHGEQIKIIVEDSTGRRIDSFITNQKKIPNNITRILKDKYGFDFTPEISKEESVNRKEDLLNFWED